MQLGCWVYDASMPTKNIVKVYGADQYYHVYNRGVAKTNIFLDRHDYEHMLGLFKRHLLVKPTFDKERRKRPNYYSDVEIVAYCLMPNHYHLLLYLKKAEGAEKLLRSVMTAYSMYFNKKYKRVGSLFQNHFLASRISSEGYLQHVTRYIHLNPEGIGQSYVSYPYSSYDYYTGTKSAEWVHEERLVETPDERCQYADFVAEGCGQSEAEDLDDELAHL